MKNIKYDVSTFNGFLIKGQLHNAIDYLKEFSSKKKLVKKYQDLFENKSKNKSNLKTMDIIFAYEQYYKNVFWLNIDINESKKLLIKDLSQLLSVEVIDLDLMEKNVKGIVEEEGFEFLGGQTQGYYGPYIWKKTIKKIYTIMLPSGKLKFTVDLMDGFISKSWLSYLSMGKIGTGGWSKADGKLCMIKRKGIKKLLSLTVSGRQRFKLSLTHEAQHAYDHDKYPGIDGVNLEYRAKLVELIYGNAVERLIWFSSEADSSDNKNTHSFASFKIVSNLSKKIFNTEYIDNYKLWEGKENHIKKYSLELLEESNESLSKKKF